MENIANNIESLIRSSQDSIQEINQICNDLRDNKEVLFAERRLRLNVEYLEMLTKKQEILDSQVDISSMLQSITDGKERLSASGWL